MTSGNGISHANTAHAHCVDGRGMSSIIVSQSMGVCSVGSMYVMMCFDCYDWQDDARVYDLFLIDSSACHRLLCQQMWSREFIMSSIECSVSSERPNYSINGVWTGWLISMSRRILVSTTSFTISRFADTHCSCCNNSATAHLICTLDSMCYATTISLATRTAVRERSEENK